jgi:hypothetical protein
VTILRDATPYSLVRVHWRFGGKFCLRFHGPRANQAVSEKKWKELIDSYVDTSFDPAEGEQCGSVWVRWLSRYSDVLLPGQPMILFYISHKDDKYIYLLSLREIDIFVVLIYIYLLIYIHIYLSSLREKENRIIVCPGGQAVGRCYTDSVIATVYTCRPVCRPGTFPLLLNAKLISVTYGRIWWLQQ